MMVLLGKAQTAAQGGRKFADCLQGKIGGNGDLIGAPEGKALGTLQDQKPMNASLTNKALREAVWQMTAEICGQPPSAVRKQTAFTTN